MGGTALAVHLQHRDSRDLDFFFDAPLDLAELAVQLNQLAPTVIQMLSDDTLNALFGDTKVQFLDVSTQRQIQAPDVIAGIRVGSLPDLLTTKLVGLTTRSALRDYVDLWALETLAGLRVEAGLALVEERYPQAKYEQSWKAILLALGSFDDVRGDQMPRMRGRRVTARQIERYWLRRVPELARNLDDTGM